VERRGGEVERVAVEGARILTAHYYNHHLGRRRRGVRELPLQRQIRRWLKPLDHWEYPWKWHRLRITARHEWERRVQMMMLYQQSKFAFFRVMSSLAPWKERCPHFS